ncbi:hypothetical protein HanHA300_Chr01g0002261 [Helianthus annuus]|nr:hypothetical protein HanHA300_Chr01g0002261 [Helianthus annuus]
MKFVMSKLSKDNKMQAKVVFRPWFLPPAFNSITTLSTSSNLCFPYQSPYVCRCKKLEEEALAGLPKHFHDELYL